MKEKQRQTASGFAYLIVLLLALFAAIWQLISAVGAVNVGDRQAPTAVLGWILADCADSADLPEGACLECSRIKALCCSFSGTTSARSGRRGCDGRIRFTPREGFRCARGTLKPRI